MQCKILNDYYMILNNKRQMKTYNIEFKDIRYTKIDQ